MKTYKFKLYPTPAQEDALLKAWGACKTTWNLMLEQRLRAERLGQRHTLLELYKTRQAWLAEPEGTPYPLPPIPDRLPEVDGKPTPLMRLNMFEAKKDLLELRNTNSVWLEHIPGMSLQEVARKLEASWQSFFSLAKKGYEGAAPPSFKGRRTDISIPYMGGLKVESPTRIRVFGVGRVRTRLQGLPEEAFSSLFAEGPGEKALYSEITRAKSGQWYIHLVIKGLPLHTLPLTEQAAGVTFDDDELVKSTVPLNVEHPHAYELVVARIAAITAELDAKLKQFLAFRGLELNANTRKRYAREAWASGRAQALFSERSRLHEKAARMRKVATDTAAIRLVRQADVICLPDLDLQALAKSKGREVMDFGIGFFYERLKALATIHGRKLVFVPCDSIPAEPEQVLRDGMAILVAGGGGEKKQRRAKRV